MYTVTDWKSLYDEFNELLHRQRSTSQAKASGWCWVQRTPDASTLNIDNTRKMEILFSQVFSICFVVATILAVLLLTPLGATAVAMILCFIAKKTCAVRQCVTMAMISKFMALLLPTAICVSAGVEVLHSLSWQAGRYKADASLLRAAKAFELLNDEDQLGAWEDAHASVSNWDFAFKYYSALFAMLIGK